MKKLISAICAIAAAAAIMPSAAAADSVDIQFKVGDSTLSINGNDVQVERPYVVGSGVTLVPLRVISEAFGAEVNWDGETQTVTIWKNETEISLQIDSKAAFVNGTETSLEEAPELTENGFTMVPLRFISETFDAFVDYDDRTRKITVSYVPDYSIALSVGDAAMTKGEFIFFAAISFENGEDISDIEQDAVAWLTVETAFNKDGLFFTDEEQAILQEGKDSFLDYFWDENDYNDYLTLNGITDEFIDRIIAWDSKAYKVFDQYISDDDVKEYYDYFYLHAKHILISAEDEYGMPIAGSRELAEDLLARAKAGEDFDTLIAEYSEDPGSFYYPDGYYFTSGEMVEEFEDAVLSLGINEIGMCESVYGYHIIRRLPLEDGAVDDSVIRQLIIDKNLKYNLDGLLDRYDDIYVYVKPGVLSSIINDAAMY